MFGPSEFNWDIVKVLLRKAMKHTPMGIQWWEEEGRKTHSIKKFREKFIQQFDTKQIEDQVSLDLIKLNPKSLGYKDITQYLEYYAEIALFSRRSFDFHKAIIFSKLLKNPAIYQLMQKSDFISNMYQLVTEISHLQNQNHSKNSSADGFPARRAPQSTASAGDTASLKSSSNSDNSIFLKNCDPKTSILHDASSTTTPASSKYSGHNSDTDNPSSQPVRKRTMGLPFKLSKTYPVFSLFSLISPDPAYKTLKDRDNVPVWVNLCLRSDSNSNFISTDLAKKYGLQQKATGYLMKIPDNYCPAQETFLPEQLILECLTQLTLCIPCKNGKWFSFTTELYIVNFVPSGITLGQPWFDRFQPHIDVAKNTCSIGEYVFQPNYKDPTKATKRRLQSKEELRKYID